MNLRNITGDILLGAFGFAFVSLVAFSAWAFGGQWLRGEAALYSAIALIFVLLSGVVLGPLAGGAGRFSRAFVPAFLVYAVIWCAAWFGLGGKTGEWAGALAGGLAFVLIAMRVAGSITGWPRAALVFLVLHCAGYFAGDWAYAYAKGQSATLAESLEWSVAGVRTTGRLAWGLFYGLGFGAGIGYVFNCARRSGAGG